MRTQILMFITAALAASAAAGDLDPPGAPWPTPGPEPRTAINAVNTPGDASAEFRITAPGSYYLADNVVASSAVNGIEIAASEVTLDLNGFALRGTVVTPGQEPLTAIIVSTEQESITIRNGNVRGWSQGGVNLSSVEGARVEGVTAANNGGIGIHSGESSVVTNCVAQENGDDGFATGRSSTVTGCTARANAAHGFDTDGSCTLSACTAQGNTRDGFNLWTASSITGCTATDNDGDGISVYYHTLVINNTCFFHKGSPTVAGIRVDGDGNRIDGNTVAANERGIDVVFGASLIVRNIVIGNTNNYSIVGGNAVGPILGPSTPITSTNPWANFSF